MNLYKSRAGTVLTPMSVESTSREGVCPLLSSETATFYYIGTVGDGSADILRSISSERNTFSGVCSLHPRG